MSSNDNITEFGALLKCHINLSQIDYCNNKRRISRNICFLDFGQLEINWFLLFNQLSFLFVRRVNFSHN